MPETHAAELLADRPVFICGHPKSGTSLLRAALDGHPELVVYPEETMFFRSYLPASAGKSLEEQIALAEQMLIHIFTWNQQNPPPGQEGYPDRDYSDVPLDAVRAALRARITQLNRHPGDMLSAAVLAYGEATGSVHAGTRGWVEKTPYDELYAKQIFTWWPAARCIHVVRDPRDNFVSYRKKHPDWTAATFAKSWLGSTKAGWKSQAKYGREHYWVMRYEDLVSDPEQVLAQVCAFLGIQDDAVLRQPTRNGRSWAGNSMFSERFHAISPQAVGRWQGQLTPAELKVIDWYAGKLMARLGYKK